MEQIKWNLFPCVVSPILDHKNYLSVWYCAYLYAWNAVLRLDVNYYYNKNINSVGISYQLLNQFKINYRVWKYKWIWEIFWWSRGLLVLNAYVIYNTDCELNSVSPMRHYKFWRRIALRNIYQKMFGGRYHLSSAEPQLGVLNHKESTALVC